jgi:hypothetical protein
MELEGAGSLRPRSRCRAATALASGELTLGRGADNSWPGEHGNHRRTGCKYELRRNQ